MTHPQHWTTAELWAALKRKLKRNLGHEGAAEWMAFAAATLREEAKRTVIEAPPVTEFRP